ncbi:MAG: hypothetical protein A3B47_00570 [Candidatus Levybacteria bacterium RIFCSPLOWO2_01_FULL_39_24]|nr:MAG: hypothetical protein A2800_00620 [Candidatus Levybacteria bacterium RIFCSPHIGHO2_01_FULL_40_16]OGH28497.1 MAG: hypothetical protein A3E12_01095 [Candidatus Levybacteria bacterium RIFCSPHIGHO2_12_FULL_39_9]OGH46270.1 MAG: hypothetical protein A3B47_00570 [Candidatus Levybacteria bacterium RIFCSPLOWO2_01_FULL_39_24]
MQNVKVKIFNTGYLLSAIGLFFYSFTQIDLGLTLSRVSVWQTAEKFFKSIGYFNRPMSALIFIIITLLLFTFYLLILNNIRKKEISRKTIWSLIIATTVILTFSYNAFSYDLFNYMFDAKIVTFYNQNPFVYKALDFPGDPMLSFMHWTHRLYPYGPTWLGLTVPLSFLGMQVFLPTFFLFKIMISATFLGTVYFISRILQKISPENELFGVAFFALNPLVIIESLVSAHNDITMIFFAMWALYLLMINKYVRSTILFILSVGTKFATLLLVPVFVVIYFLKKYKREINWERMMLLSIVSMLAAVFVVTLRTTFQPWYLLYVLPFVAIVPNKYYVIIPTVIISFAASLQYLPFLYLGNWDSPVPSILFWMTIGSFVLSLLSTVAWKFKKVLR